MSNNLKPLLFEACQFFLDDRLIAVQKMITELQAALQSETKSSAGDKHETGRAMIQLEREKAGQQLAEIQKTNQSLRKIDIHTTSTNIVMGSVVITTKVNYFIAISAGELEIDSASYFAISAQTPIAQLLLGKTVGDKIQFRDQSFQILKVI
ncbi:hypothetical protein SAMN04515667_0464 [Formosa sp. Hel1_31_208]|uniref:3-oxoacyl-ACP synthase n=1 Tax=Formosa sp. Hel1_31_208 TaxID=1798225 RepID=UPI00087C7BB4|nr:3-oxoacyl-ACP synthase [Formosa sp. Hel1_31_208]SDR72824.1 hypothetical protein SAMN04515667_0464 [Formosa sp. Hel1_31_208]